MGRHLTDTDLRKIAKGIGTLDDPITWDAVVNHASAWTGTTITRQTLSSKPVIRKAMNDRKKVLKLGKAQQRVPSHNALLQRIERLQKDLAEEKAKHTAVESQFATMQYNAYALGLTQDELMKPLPAKR